MKSKKTLYVLATPIGNINEISERAITVLKQQSNFIIESKNKTFKLLNQANISIKDKKFFYLKKENENTFALSNLHQDYLLVSDAGYPVLCDPGYKLVQKMHEAGYYVEVINGPSAILHSLLVSNFPPFPFVFYGFLPKKSFQIEKALIYIKEIRLTTVCFLSSHSVEKTLNIIDFKFPDWKICLAKELTKKHENYIIGTASEIIQKKSSYKGEFCLVFKK